MMYDIAVIGGGPAGTSAAITSARLGAGVLLLERSHFPRHKVCGEFISSESIRLLGSLLQHESALLSHAPRVTNSRIFVSGSVLEARLPGPSTGVQRYELDWALWQAARAAGVDGRMRASVERIARDGYNFVLSSTAGDFHARSVVDATGRWSNLRPANAPSAFWVGIKTHFFTSDAKENDSVDLYFSPRGYCGVQPVGTGLINVCAMVQSSELGNSREHILDRVLNSHVLLRERSLGWERALDIVTTSPLVFRPPIAQREGILRVGDAAGFIDPFAGDGISLALRSGALAAQCLKDAWSNTADLHRAAEEYATAYARCFTPLFRRTAILRRMSRLPSPVQTALLPIFRHRRVAEFLVRATRPH